MSFSEVLSDLIKRDCRDKNRTVAPLIAAKDAFFVDSSTKNAEEVFRVCVILPAECQTDLKNPIDRALPLNKVLSELNQNWLDSL